MHTSSGVDNIDEYLETIAAPGRRLLLSLRRRGAAGHGEDDHAALPHRRAAWRSGPSPSTAPITGPIVREADGQWVSVRLMHEPVKALMQSLLRTKAQDYASFRESMELHTNSSNNTVYADADGNIAYFHANFVPQRDPRFDWTQPVDGSDPATDWQGVHRLRREPERDQPAERLGLQHEQLAVLGRRRGHAARRQTIRPTWTRAARTRAASTPCACSRAPRTSRSTRCATPPSTPTSPPSPT